VIATLFDSIALGIAFAAGTLFVGWWSIPIIALVWGWLVGPARRPATRAAAGAVLAWIGFLAFDAMRGPIGRLARTLGATMMNLPPAVLVVVTVLFAAVLAWSAAIVGASFRPETAPAIPADRP
jgi:hypothetical protein